MKVLIVGCGRLGSELAYLLYKNGHDVSIIDVDEAAFDILQPDFQGHMVEGDALSQEVLKRAGIDSANAVAAVTSDDATNLVVGKIAADIYQIDNVVTRNFEPNIAPIFELFNLEVVRRTSWGASRFEELLLNESFKMVYSFGDGTVDYYQVLVSQPWVGKKVGDLQLSPKQCLLASITREGTSFIPTVDDILEKNDLLHFSATPQGIDGLRNKFYQKEQEG